MQRHSREEHEHSRTLLGVAVRNTGHVEIR